MRSGLAANFFTISFLGICLELSTAVDKTERNLEYCGEEDMSITWDTDDPRFTPWLEKLFLSWTPCVFLWVFAPFSIRNLLKRKTWIVPWVWLNATKLFLTSVLVILSLTDLATSVLIFCKCKDIHIVRVATPAAMSITFILAAILVILNKTRRVRSSTSLFLFWVLTVVCNTLQYNDDLKELHDQKTAADILTYITSMVYYPTVLIMLVLNFFDDPLSRVSRPSAKKVPVASISSKDLFCWFNKLIWIGYRRKIGMKDLQFLSGKEWVKGIAPQFDSNYKKHLGEPTYASHETPPKEVYPTIWIPLMKTFWPSILFGFSLEIGRSIFLFADPFFLRQLISFTKSDEEAWHGYLYAVALMVAVSSETFLAVHYSYFMKTVSLKVQVALTAVIYKKALRLSSDSRKESTSGEIVNMMSVDASRFVELMEFIPRLAVAPFQITVAMYCLWNTIGPSVLGGIAVMVIVTLVNIPIFQRGNSSNEKQMEYTDERMKMMNEIISEMKVLKLYAWEASFKKYILEIRAKELKMLKQIIFMNCLTEFTWSCTPIFVALFTFCIYVMVNGSLNLGAEEVFSTIALLHILKDPLVCLPGIISDIVQACVSAKRIDKFMNADEINPNSVSHFAAERDPLIIEGGNFSWCGSTPVLRDINISVEDKSLVAVVGSIGSGKSSLLSAFLGEMNRKSGRVNTKGSIAYVPQQAWILNATLRDNILFGHEYMEQTYNLIIEACALANDIAVLPDGHQTEIGEKGVNLSGGQKQRISLARAVYSRADVYFLDDPLSAVDCHVGKHIFQHVIGPQGLLKNKTRVLVTHGLTFLPEVDGIYVLEKGKISEYGTYKHLIKTNGAFAELAQTYLKKSERNTETEESQPPSSKIQPEMSPLFSNQKEDKANKILEEDFLQTGNLKWSVLHHYLRAIGWRSIFFALLFVLLFEAFSIGSNYWLANWTSKTQTRSDANQHESGKEQFLKTYVLLGVSASLCAMISGLVMRFGCMKASRQLHDDLLQSVLRAPLSFSDLTPSGRILSRFSDDIDTMDNELPKRVANTVNDVIDVAGIVFIITHTTPGFFCAILPLAIIYFLIQKLYRATSRQLLNLESISKAPIFSHFTETVAGVMAGMYALGLLKFEYFSVQVIRAYGVTNRFIQELARRMEDNQMCLLSIHLGFRWVAVRTQLVGSLIIFFAAFSAVLKRDTLSAGLAGLSISYALQVTTAFNWLVRMASDIETEIVSVQRVKEYIDIQKEADWDIPATAPPVDWPNRGKILFKNFKVRYRSGLDLILKGLSFCVNENQKIGIVGRTGAGKSSLTLALFRIIEPAEGSIHIDGIDISQLGLHVLRSRLTVIPQDPVLFSGNLRMNLDPLKIYSDNTIWHALKLSHLKEFVESLEGGLQHEVAEGGENFSVGQRQLICLARALLRKTQILILDEATASVDVETDSLIQKTIRTEFRDCTVLTIAHRLNTIMDSDRILVLEQGLIKEYDTPANLVRNKSSLFYSLVKESGLDTEGIPPEQNTDS